MQRSNKWDAAKDVLLVGKRVEMLENLERTPRSYLKKARYWHDTNSESGIIATRAKRHRLCRTNVPMCDTENNTVNVENMTPEMIKSRLVELGIKTRVRNIERLGEIYRAATR